MAAATDPGAQTERRGGAGPVRGLLGGKDLTGRFSRRVISRNRSAIFRPRGGSFFLLLLDQGSRFAAEQLDH